MSLNTISFPKKIIAELYKNNLVELTNTSPVFEKKKEPENWKYLGENKKKVLIVVKYPEAVHLPDDTMGFLINLLSACKLNLGDTAILNLLNQSDKGFKDILAYFESKTVFLFGVGPAEFGMPLLFPHFQIQQFNNTVFLSSPSLHDIESDKVLKSKLWICIKKIFAL